MTFDWAVNQETDASGRRYRNITLTCGRVEFGADATPREAGGHKQLYNRVPQTVWVSWSSRQAEFSSSCSHSSSSSRSRGKHVVVRASARQRAGPSGPRLSSPAEWGRSAAIIRWNLGSICGSFYSVSKSPLTHNQHQPFRNPFENKEWEVYFSKEVCSFVIIVDYVSAWKYRRTVVLRLYNTVKLFQVLLTLIVLISKS